MPAIAVPHASKLRIAKCQMTCQPKNAWSIIHKNGNPYLTTRILNGSSTFPLADMMARTATMPHEARNSRWRTEVSSASQSLNRVRRWSMNQRINISLDNGRVHRAAANDIVSKSRAARGSVCNPLLSDALSIGFEVWL